MVLSLPVRFPPFKCFEFLLLNVFAVVGDLKNGRTVHSLVRLLALYNVTLNFVAPASLSMPDSVKAYAKSAGVPFYETTNLDDVIGKSDVLYVTRVQQERFASKEEYDAVKDAYVVNNEVLTKAKENMIVMHPLPRTAEIDPEVDFDSRAAYFRQMKYGLFLRMALLSQGSCSLRDITLKELLLTSPVCFNSHGSLNSFVIPPTFPKKCCFYSSVFIVDN